MSTTVAVSAPEPPQQQISAVGRLIGVFFSPGATFADIARKPSWLAPVVVMTVLGLIVSFALNQRVNWHDVVMKQIDASSRASQLSTEQKEQQADVGAKFSVPFSYGIGLLGPILAVLIVGGVMLGAYNLLGGANATFKASMAIVSHAYFVTIISSLLFVLVLFLKPAGTVDLENPVATNLGAFMPDTAAKWLVKLATSIDLFSFWVMALIAIGFAAWNPRKLKFGSAFGIALLVWGVYVVCKVGWAAIFS